MSLDGLPPAHLRVLLDGLPVFERYGLLLAGGYAFRAHEILHRPSQDLDFATRDDTPLPEIAAHDLPVHPWNNNCRASEHSPACCWPRVLPGSTQCYTVFVDAYPEITQRDLRTRSREIMDAVEHGQSFTVTRDGHRIGALIPLRRRRRFVPLETFRADQDAALDYETGSAYER